MMNGAVDESLLERAGADAAAQGRTWRSNPYLQREQLPDRTGESLTRWACRHDAWQRGFEAYRESREWRSGHDVESVEVAGPSRSDAPQ